jgi:hypothetical protein
MDLVWTWYGLGMDLIRTWYGLGMDLVWTLPFGVASRYAERSMNEDARSMNEDARSMNEDTRSMNEDAPFGVAVIGRGNIVSNKQEEMTTFQPSLKVLKTFKTFKVIKIFKILSTR